TCSCGGRSEGADKLSAVPRPTLGGAEVGAQTAAGSSTGADSIVVSAGRSMNRTRSIVVSAITLAGVGDGAGASTRVGGAVLCAGEAIDSTGGSTVMRAGAIGPRTAGGGAAGCGGAGSAGDATARR